MKFFKIFMESRLLHAIKEGKESKVRKLIAEGANINYEGKYHTTPLSLAITSRYENIVKYLIEKGAQLPFLQKDPKEDYYGTYLSLAIAWKEYGVADFLLKQEIVRKNINFKDRENNSALSYAVNVNNPALVKELIEYGAEVDVTYFGEPIIIKAARENNLKITKLLLNKNPELINKQDNFGNTAIMYATSKNLKGMINQLFEYEPDLSIKNAKGKTIKELATNPDLIAMFKNEELEEKNDLHQISEQYYAAINYHVQKSYPNDRVKESQLEQVGHHIVINLLNQIEILIKNGLRDNNLNGTLPAILLALGNLAGEHGDKVYKNNLHNFIRSNYVNMPNVFSAFSSNKTTNPEENLIPELTGLKNR